MSIFSKIGTYFTAKRIGRLERDLKLLENKIKFEPKYSKIPDYFTSDAFTCRMAEYFVWHAGDTMQIRTFFSDSGHRPTTLGTSSPESNYFWETAPDDYRFVHSGIPALISSKNAVILFGKGFSFEVSVKNSEGKDDEAMEEKIKARTDTLIESTNLEELLVKAADAASWGGHVFPKISYDCVLSQHPIVEMVDIRNGEEIKKRGMTQQFVFKSYFSSGEGERKVQYRLDEIYRLLKAGDLMAEVADPAQAINAEVGDACIEYRLIQMGKDGKETEMAFESFADFPETNDIAKPIIAFPGIKFIPALGVPNRLPNNDFPDSPYGASDYAHSSGLFDALDENLSELSRETRDNKTIRFWPKDLLTKDTDGKIVGVKSYIRNAVQKEKSLDQDATNNVETQEIADKTESITEKFKQTLSLACNNAGISPLALGITGLEAMNAGEESQRERNKVTLETRDLKLQIWGPKIEKFLKMLVKFDEFLHSGSVEGFEKYPELLGEVDFRIYVHFPDYIIASDNENTDLAVKGMGGGVYSEETAVRTAHPDWPDDKVLEETTLLRFSKGLSADNPNALSIPNILNPPKEGETK